MSNLWRRRRHVRFMLTSEKKFHQKVSPALWDTVSECFRANVRNYSSLRDLHYVYLYLFKEFVECSAVVSILKTRKPVDCAPPIRKVGRVFLRDTNCRQTQLNALTKRVEKDIDWKLACLL